MLLKLTSLLLVFNSCVEEYEPPELNKPVSLLVVDAVVTSEDTVQKIRLWQSGNLGASSTPIPEVGANVKIIIDNNEQIELNESEPGSYESESAWAVEEKRTYQLHITRANGSVYESTPTVAPTQSKLETVEAKVTVSEEGERGMSILVNSFDPTQSSRFYRYEYTEAYKIVAPEWSPFEFDIINREYPEFEVGIKLNENNKRTCYGTDSSKEILQHSTSNLTEDRVLEYEIRFIPQSSYILSHRYTILVSQYVQTPDAHAFTAQLKNQEGNGNLLSNLQPGFLQGNIYSIQDPNEKVAGYFDVSTVDKKRIFVNYEDLFPNEALPPYAIDCNVVLSPPLFSLGAHQMGITSSPLIDAIDAHTITYVAENNDFNDIHESPFYVVKAECGDCSLLGSPTKPDFWIE